jgi:uncharacterized RDD family membrane protein YckC
MMMTGYTTLLNGVAQDRQAGRPIPPPEVLAQQTTNAIWPGVLGFVVVTIVVRFVYEVGFLKGFQATPGKMVLGLQVRLRNRPGPLPWGAVLARWATQYGYGVLSVLATATFLTGTYWLLDNLWPLWDGKRQALHDKAAGTNVVFLR